MATKTTDVLNPTVLATQLIEASAAYIEALSDVNDTTVALGAAEITKANATAATLLSNLDDPKRLGSNEAARDASIRNLNLVEFNKVDELRQTLAFQKGILNENEIAYGTLKMLVRLAAVAAGVNIE